MLLPFTLCLLCGTALFGQTDDSIRTTVAPGLFERLASTEANGGSVSLRGEATANDLVKLHIQKNKDQRTFSGYRIQIFSGNSLDYSMEQLQKMRSDIEEDFPDIPVYLNYFDPDFKIRAGNFRSRLDCIPTLKRIRSKYPAAYPVKMDILTSDLQKKAEPEETQSTDSEEGTDEKSMF